MAKTDLSAEQVRSLFDYDPETGVMRWREGAGWPYSGRSVGTPNDRGYLRVMIGRRSYRVHRIIWLHVHGEWPDQIDHINGKKDDNRLSNLRSVSNAQNHQNKTCTTGKTGVRGVRARPDGRFEAAITLNRKTKYLGSFASVDEAKEAYRIARQELHPFSPEAATQQGNSTQLH